MPLPERKVTRNFMLYAFPLLVVAIGVYFRIAMAAKMRTPDRAIDLGEVVLAVILIYGFVPGIGFILAEYRVGQIEDGRLYNGYLIQQIEQVQLMFLLISGSFAVIYTILRKPVAGKIDHAEQANQMVWPVFTLVVALTVTLSIVGLIWGTNASNDYIGSYLELRAAPLFVRQFAGLGSQIQLALIIAAITMAIAARPTKHLYVALALLVYMLFTMLTGGARTNAFLAFLAYVIAASIYVRGFELRRASMLAIPALMLFLLAGLLRGDSEQLNLYTFFQNSEFTGVFVTAVDLHIRFPEGFSGQAPFNIYTVDLLRLIPSQFLSFEKISPGEWYAGTFYEGYFNAGGAFAFGILAETVLGKGAPEAITRGALLGAMFALLANWLNTQKSSPMKIVAYVWVMVIGYQCYRDTTFSIVGRALFHLTPVLIYLTILQSNRKAAPTSKLARIN